MNRIICFFTIAVCFTWVSGCMKLGKKGSLKTDVEASLSDDDVRAFIERITGVAETPTSISIKGETLIFKAKSERGVEVRYAFEKDVDQKLCTTDYSDWIDIESRITVPVSEFGLFKMCLLGRFGSKESASPVVYDIKIEPEDAASLE